MSLAAAALIWKDLLGEWHYKIARDLRHALALEAELDTFERLSAFPVEGSSMRALRQSFWQMDAADATGNGV